jgi:hypothetical protein
MKTIRLQNKLISLLVVATILFVKCDEDNEENTIFNFPSIENIDAQVYEEIKKTCDTYWDLNNMIDTTFEIISDADEYSVHCDGIIEGKLYHFVIRVDKFGKWINSGRSIIITSDNFIDIIHMLNYNDFEKIKNFILENGDREGYSNMYNNNPHYSFDSFETYLNPEIGQLNINCDPAISDFNEIVIRDLGSDPQYFYLLIVHIGDLEKEQITGNISGLIEGKVYLLKYYKYDLDKMSEKVKIYIDEMKEIIE